MSKDYQNNPINGKEHVREQLSDYMDGLLAGEARDGVRAHLETCADCRADYIELRATRKLMQSMPPVAAPRAFTLTPEMAGKARKTSFWEGFFGRQNAPRLATGSLVAFLLLFLFVAGDFLGKVNPEAASIRTANSQSAPAVPSGGSAPQPAAAGASDAAAAPTDTTAPSGARGAPVNPYAQNQTSPSNGAESQPTASPMLAAAPQVSSTPGETGTDGSAKQNTQSNPITASGNSSPTTITLGELPDAHSFGTSAIPPPSGAPSDNGGTGWIVLQIGLLALGLGLGVAAFIAWRRS